MKLPLYLVFLFTVCWTAMALTSNLQDNITKWFQRVTVSGLNNWNQIELAVEDNELLIYYSGYHHGISPESLRISTISNNMCPLLVRHYFDTPAPADTNIIACQRKDATISSLLPDINFGNFDVSALNFQHRN